MNIVMLSGYVGRDPMIRTFPNGDRVAQFSLATSKVYRDRQTNEFTDKTEWHRIRVYGPATGGLVDRVIKMITKGSHINIVGELSNNSVVSGQGERFSVTYIDVRRAEGLEILDKRRDREARAEAQASSTATQQAVAQAPAAYVPAPTVPAPVPAPAPAPVAPAPVSVVATAAPAPTPVVVPTTSVTPDAFVLEEYTPVFEAAVPHAPAPVSTPAPVVPVMTPAILDDFDDTPLSDSMIDDLTFYDN